MWPSPTGGSNWPPLVQKCYRHQQGAQTDLLDVLMKKILVHKNMPSFKLVYSCELIFTNFKTCSFKNAHLFALSWTIRSGFSWNHSSISGTGNRLSQNCLPKDKFLCEFQVLSVGGLAQGFASLLAGEMEIETKHFTSTSFALYRSYSDPYCGFKRMSSCWLLASGSCQSDHLLEHLP